MFVMIVSSGKSWKVRLVWWLGTGPREPNERGHAPLQTPVLIERVAAGLFEMIGLVPLIALCLDCHWITDEKQHWLSQASWHPAMQRACQQHPQRLDHRSRRFDPGRRKSPCWLTALIDSLLLDCPRVPLINGAMPPKSKLTPAYRALLLFFS